MRPLIVGLQGNAQSTLITMPGVIADLTPVAPAFDTSELRGAKEADEAKHQASSASEADKPEAEADQAEAEKRQLGAKAEAAAACAKAMLEIVGDIPEAGSLEEGLKIAGDQVSALVPTCKDSVASAGS
jgi:hypothetical protein